jgi:hypothetical protein
MHDLAQIELSDLYDLLAQQTNRYMKMLSEGATKQEFDQCREIIIDIQTEIQSRKNQQPRNKTAASNTLHNNSFINRTKN